MHWGVLRTNHTARRFYARFAREDDSLLYCHMAEAALATLAGTSPASAATIRPAGREDAPLLGRMLTALLQSLGADPLGFDPVPRLAADGFGPHPRFAALVAEVGAEAAGYALFWPIYDTEMGGPLMFLSDLFVAEAERGRGLAEDLMGAVARRALAAGHRGMSWEVLRDNHRARAFYRRLTAESDAVIVVNCAGDDFRRLAAEAPAGLSLPAADVLSPGGGCRARSP
jgi:GNAT superfamily N-acetyltransferase